MEKKHKFEDFQTINDIPDYIWDLCMINDPLFTYINIPNPELTVENGIHYIMMPTIDPDVEKIRIEVGTVSDSVFLRAMNHPEHAYAAISALWNNKESSSYMVHLVYTRQNDDVANTKVFQDVLVRYKECLNLRTPDDVYNRLELAIKMHNSITGNHITVNQYINTYGELW